LRIEAGLIDLLLSHSTIKSDSFRVNFNPSLAARLVSSLAPNMGSRYTLPHNWQFNTFTLEQYRRVLLTLQALMLGWHTVRTIVANNGTQGMGYRSSVWVVPYAELLARIADLITFGSNQIRDPDISVQPLVDLKNGFYAIDPFVLLNTNVERNLCVLLNQIPSERAAYSRLSNDKEAATKAEIIQVLASHGFDFRSGPVAGTNTDLAVIDRTNKVCLCLELKWFIEPAEIREVEQRTEELAQGIVQAKKIKRLFETGDTHLLEKVLDIDLEYTFLCAVGSVNWIGFGDVQDEEIPIIKVWHLLRLLKETGSLLGAIKWLRNRDYLPKEGLACCVEPWEITCGIWSATWYGIKPLAEAF
jgi:hypothetical protein